MISKDELLKGRDKQFPNDYTDEISTNLDLMVEAMNQIRTAWGKPMTVDSGWRSPSINASTPGAAAHSKHMLGLACDIADPDGSLMNWVLENLQLMKDLGVYMEHFCWTPSWVHFQLGSPTSGHRIFIPNSTRNPNPSKWDGNYDNSFDD